MPWNNPKSPSAGGGVDTHAPGGGWDNPSSHTAPAAAPAKSGGGILGKIGHFFAQAGSDVANVAYHAPGGIYQLGKAGAHDFNKATKSLPGGNTDLTFGLLGKPVKPKGGYELPGIAKAAGKQIESDVQHPLRHPGYTLLDLLPVIGAAGKVAEAGRAASALEGASAVDRAGTAAKALVVRPEPRPRLFQVGEGDKPLTLHPSLNPSVRAAQGVHDMLLRHALENNPEGRIAGYATRRLGGAGAETRRYRDEMRAAPAQLLAQTGKPLDDVEQAALRLTAEQALPEESIALHQRQLDAGVNPADQARQIKLLSQVRDRGIISHDPSAPNGQKVTINPEYVAAKRGLAAKATRGLLGKRPDVQAVDERLAEGGAERDKILADTGQMPAEGLQSRIDAPNRFRAGAKYVAPTAAREGRPEFRSVDTPEGKRMVAVQSVLEREQAKLDKLHADHEKALARDEQAFHAARNRDLGPLTPGDAQTRLDQLDKTYNELVANLIPHTSEYGGKLSQREQLQRNFENSRAGKGKRVGMSKKPTVKAEEFRNAEAAMHDALAANPDHPVTQRALKLINERDQLRQALQARVEHQMGIGEGGEPPPLPRGPAWMHASVPPVGNTPYRNTISRLGQAIEDQTARVAKIRKQVEARIEPTGIVGGEDARAGRQYVPYYKSETKSGGPAATPRASSPIVGKVRGLISKKKPLTGEAQLEAHVPDNTTGLVARQMERAYKHLASDTFRRDITQVAGHDTRQSPRDVLVNTQELEHAKVPEELRAELGQKRWTLDELQGHANAYEAFRQMLVPGLKDKFAGEAAVTKAPEGFKFVDRNLLAELGKPGMAQFPGMRTIDTVNAAQTAATVYFKIGHVATRAGTNAVANLMQGSLNPVAMTHAYNLWEELTPLERVRALAAAGEGGIHALPAEAINAVGQVARGGALWWSKHFDAPSRFLSLAYEARKAGYGSPAKFRELLDHAQDPASHGLDAAQTAKVDWIVKRANREPIAYNRLNEFERRYVRRAIWFYPWIKGASQFAINTMLEHPYKAGVIGQAGALGTKEQQSELGPLPSYERALFKVGGSDLMPTVENVGTVSPFETPGEVLETLTHLNKPTESERLSAYLTPALSAAARVFFNLDENGRPVESKYGGPAKNAGVLHNLFAGFGQSTPELALYKALTAKKADQQGKMFPADPELGWLRFFLGSVVPRPMNRDVANSAAQRDRASAGR